jgi:hypothetical protein
VAEQRTDVLVVAYPDVDAARDDFDVLAELVHARKVEVEQQLSLIGQYGGLDAWGDEKALYADAQRTSGAAAPAAEPRPEG